MYKKDGTKICPKQFNKNYADNYQQDANKKKRLGFQSLLAMTICLEFKLFQMLTVTTLEKEGTQVRHNIHTKYC